MPERKDTAGKDAERQARGRAGPPTQSRAEKKRRTSREGGAGKTGTVPKVGKRDPSRGDTSGDGLH